MTSSSEWEEKAYSGVTATNGSEFCAIFVLHQIPNAPTKGLRYHHQFAVVLVPQCGRDEGADPNELQASGTDQASDARTIRQAPDQVAANYNPTNKRYPTYVDKIFQSDKLLIRAEMELNMFHTLVYRRALGEELKSIWSTLAQIHDRPDDVTNVAKAAGMDVMKAGGLEKLLGQLS